MRSHRSPGEEVDRNHEGVQEAVDNYQEDLGVAGIVEGLAYPEEARGGAPYDEDGGPGGSA